MPGFQTLVSGKRALEGGEERPSKRLNSGNHEEYWVVQWRHHQGRKHKTWNGDGVLQIIGTSAILFDSDNSRLGSGKVEPPFSEGVGFSGIGGKEVELERSIPKSEFLSGRCFGSGSGSSFVAPNQPASTPNYHQSAAKQYAPPKPSSGSEKRNFVPLQPVSLLSSGSNVKPSSSSAPDSYWTVNWRKTGHSNKNRPWDGDAYLSCVGSKKITLTSEKNKILGTTGYKDEVMESGTRFFISSYEVQLDLKIPVSQFPGNSGTNVIDVDDFEEIAKEPPKKAFVTPASFYGSAPKTKIPTPLHDPEADGAIVMKAPTKDHGKRFNPKNLPIVSVVLDPSLSRHLRPHQVEGVKFLYECVMGLSKHDGQGCILADAMGLGKTLQTITLIWTLLRQNPYGNVGPAIKKAVVVCPVSLVNNWRSEFHKWIGRDRISLAVCDKDKIDNVIAGFMNSKNIPILIIGYERLRTVINKLSVMVPPIGLVICDEGHRLKSANNKTNKMFAALKTPRRVILSGTPIQNDLSELHTMAEFCNPGLLDDYPTFKRVYEMPILKSRAPDSSTKQVEVGEARSDQLSTITKSFVLRREATILNNYLPPKHEYIVFIKPTTLQREIFGALLNPKNMSIDDLSSTNTAESLAMINLLTKASNDPILLNSMVKKNKDNLSFRQAAVQEAVGFIPDTAQLEDVNLSGKLMALAKLLKVIHRTTDEKCVIVSHFTSTLGILEAYCQKKNYSYRRLDGQTQAAKRQEYVNSFNKSSQDKCFIFLLSSKAGGVGINLIGGSRLCLVDCDWNPSHDLQSMARCHRDGQKKPVHIYRFFTSGAIDEKIYQRQVTKLGLSNSLIGSNQTKSKDGFTRKELRDIFTVHMDTPCNTHDLLECQCSSSPQEDESGDLEEDDTGDSTSQSAGFKSAGQVTAMDVGSMDKVYLQKKKAGLATLSEWDHVNCLNPSCWNQIEDDVLRHLLHWKEDPTSVVDPGLSLLDAVDAGVKTMRDVPFEVMKGGTVGFVFQKVTTTPLLESQEEEDEGGSNAQSELDGDTLEDYIDPEDV